MKWTAFAVAVAAITMFAQSASAREHHHRHGHHHHHRLVASRGSFAEARAGWRAQEHSDRRSSMTNGMFGLTDPNVSSAAYRGHNRGRPAAWCGWQMRHLVGADPGPSFNLARNWAHWGRPGRAGIGAVVVWAHHVGKIVGQANGQWVIESGNDGHALRTRPRSIAGAIAIRWS
jgi:hypothetical protein